jgi:hypothetical protein
MSPAVETSAIPTAVGDVTTGARLIIHLKENNVQYLLGVIAMHMLGITDRVFNYGVGLCG